LVKISKLISSYSNRYCGTACFCSLCVGSRPHRDNDGVLPSQTKTYIGRRCHCTDSSYASRFRGFGQARERSSSIHQVTF